MDFSEKISQFASKVSQIKDNVVTEEATKTSLILPFFQLLGYDVFNPLEFIPEFTADTGTKKGEKVDYAIMINGDPVILVEAKSANAELSNKHMSQLFRYFAVTKARFGILTNGLIYRFYSDLEEPNKMDSSPFLEINLLHMKSAHVNELKRFQKESFNIKGILNKASDLKYAALIKNEIIKQFENPSDQFVRLLLNKDIYNGVKTQAVLDKFRDIIRGSINEYITDLINDRFQNAINADSASATGIAANKEKKPLQLSQSELDMLDYIRALLNTNENITYHKTSNYISMHLGGNSRKWICRIYTRQTNHLFALHKFENTDYECEYYFDEIGQLDQIVSIILDVFSKCIAI